MRKYYYTCVQSSLQFVIIISSKRESVHAHAHAHVCVSEKQLEKTDYAANCRRVLLLHLYWNAIIQHRMDVSMFSFIDFLLSQSKTTHFRSVVFHSISLCSLERIA